MQHFGPASQVLVPTSTARHACFATMCFSRCKGFGGFGIRSAAQAQKVADLVYAVVAGTVLWKRSMKGWRE